MSHLPIDLENYPGYHIRRLQQIAVAVFLEETGEWGITPVQYGALSAVSRNPDIGQRTLARLIGLDTSTIGSVVDRLEARELMARKSSPTDRRTWLLSVTPQGRKLLKNAEPCVLRAQQRMLDPLPQDKRQLFMEMLAFLTTENDKLARSPSAKPTARPRKKA